MGSVECAPQTAAVCRNCRPSSNAANSVTLTTPQAASYGSGVSEGAWLLVVGSLAAPALLGLLWLLPKYQTSAIADPERRFALENEARKTLAQVFGGAAFITGLYFTMQNLWLASEKQATESFTSAIESLATEHNLPAQLGGVYALERLRRDSPQDYFLINEILSAYIRRRAWRQDCSVDHLPSDDEFAALAVIARRGKTYGHGEQLRLNLRGAVLCYAHLEARANLNGVELSDAVLTDASLQHADLRNSILERIWLSEARLEDSDMSGADLSGAHLGGAHLEHAHLDGACLTGADLENTHLNGTVLSTTRGVSKAEYAKADSDKDTKPPTTWDAPCGSDS